MLLKKSFTTFGQAYGSDTYSAQEYGCVEGQASCQTEAAPNTGFFSSPDAALATSAGALLVALAIVGIVYVIVSRIKYNKKQKQQ